MLKESLLFLTALGVLVISNCSQPGSYASRRGEPTVERIPIVIDTDANNELDDQHALAYLFFNDQVFDVVGVTVNATVSGGDVSQHLAEARRVMQLCAVWGEIPLRAGADGDFEEIRPSLEKTEFDGHAAVNFIIEEARKERDRKLVLLSIGKLTNIALALESAPDIKENVRIAWLGSNFPDRGEYNQENDMPALNYILDQSVPFEIVVVRYGKPSGSDAVRITPADVAKRLAGAGPKVDPVAGRHGRTFTSFGDYSVNLFEGIDLYGDPPSRALFDVVAVAILKNPTWGEAKDIPAPILINEEWHERPGNSRTITLWEDFDKRAILEDFFTMIQAAGM